MNLTIIKYFWKLVLIVFLIQTVIVLCDKPICPENHETNKQFIFISTLDGKLTALNIADGGTEAWELSTEPGALLSSNIDKLELSNHGHWIRMIPSLSGSLYKFDGENLDRIPFTVDSLLKSSFRYNDDFIISGGKISRTYGVDMNTGQLLYECDMTQCNNITTTGNSYTEIDRSILILQRQTQIVRASEPRSGIERWNFSVGLHDLKVFIDLNNNCYTTNPTVKLNYKINIPNGVVTAVALDRPHEVVWTHKSKSPIVNVWKFEHGKIEAINLFELDHNMNSISPLLYLGMHQKQLYIQESDKVFAIKQTSYQQSLLEGDEEIITRIPWKPIPVSSQLVAKSSSAVQTIDDVSKTTAISVLYASEYINGNGYYLYGPKQTKRITDVKKKKHIKNNKTELDQGSIITFKEMPVEIIIVSIWYWWKEVLFISVLTAILINIFIQSRFARIINFIRNYLKKNEDIENTKELIINNIDDCCKDSGVELSSNIIVQKQVHSSVEFKSRYLQDFEPISCLGKGGFGIVFEARNKIDDCHYAIKRIPLPSQEESRNRVLREVKALAKLDHQHIVRYFNTWLEEPPSGWQEKLDNDWMQTSCDENINSNIKTDEKEVNNLLCPIKHVRAKSLSTMITLPESSEELSDILNNPRALQSYVNDKSDSSFIVFDHQTNDSNKKDFILDISSDNLTKSNKRRRHRSECDTSNTHGDRRVTRHYLYIQMQLCHQNSLREWLKDNIKNRDMKFILDIFSQIVQAVEYVHLQGLIHRDLKPSNIFFSLDGQIKIGDFGLVTEMIESEEGMSVCDNKKKWLYEQHTDRVGTQLYMSPEQISGMSYNYKVDIYSLGVIFFELLNPFTTEMERYQTLTKLRNNTFPSQFSKHFKNEYDLLCLMLSPNPKVRPTTFGIRARPPLSAADPKLNSTVTDSSCDFELNNRKKILSNKSITHQK